MVRNELFIAHDLLDVCRGWQEAIDQTPAVEDKDAAGEAACSSLDSIDGFLGTSSVIVKSDLAIVLKDPSEGLEEADTAVRYSDVVLKGWLGKIRYMRLNEYGALAWPIYDATVLREPDVTAFDDSAIPSVSEYFQTDGSRRPVYLPVGFIDYALLAARQQYNPAA